MAAIIDHPNAARITGLGEHQHLTAADRAKVRAVLAHPRFMLGERFRAGRKTLTITHLGGDRYEVVLLSQDRDNWEGELRTRRQTVQFTLDRKET